MAVAVEAGEVSLQAAMIWIQMAWSFSDGRGKDIKAGRQAIGKVTRRSERTVRRHIAALEVAGWLEVQHRVKQYPDGTWPQLVNGYRFQVPEHFVDPAELRRPTGTGEGDDEPIGIMAPALVAPDELAPEPMMPERQAWAALSPQERDRSKREATIAAATLRAQGCDDDSIVEQLRTAGFGGPAISAAMRSSQPRAGP